MAVQMIALPVRGTEIAPILDLSPWVAVVNPERRTETKLHVKRLDSQGRVDLLRQAGVKTVICGCVSRGLQTMLETTGIRVVWGIAGPLTDVLEAFLTKRLQQSQYRILPRQNAYPTEHHTQPWPLGW